MLKLWDPLLILVVVVFGLDLSRMFFLLLQNYFYALTDVRALKELIQRSGRKLKAVVAMWFAIQ